MPDIIHGGPERYEVEWFGASGTWWHGSWHEWRWAALLRAALTPGSTRVINYQPDTEQP